MDKIQQRKCTILNNKINAAIVQFDVKKGQVRTNMETVLGYLRQLAVADVHLAVLPEMFSCSFDNDRLKDHAGQTDQIIEQFCLFSKQNNMALSGTLPEQEGDHIFNTMVFIDTDGKIKARYRKLHLFKLTDEHLYYTAGSDTCVIDTSFGKIGMMTCYDLRFPELARALFLQGARMIIVSAQWPSPRKEHWKTLIKARAIENQLFMICANRTGTEDDLKFPGMSMIVDPFGTVLTDAKEPDGVATAVLEMEKVEQYRTLIPCMADRRADIYG